MEQNFYITSRFLALEEILLPWITYLNPKSFSIFLVNLAYRNSNSLNYFHFLFLNHLILSSFRIIFMSDAMIFTNLDKQKRTLEGI